MNITSSQSIQQASWSRKRTVVTKVYMVAAAMGIILSASHMQELNNASYVLIDKSAHIAQGLYKISQGQGRFAGVRWDI